ncbi:hypothetical protein [Shimia isoporae]|nr:hypothetical protein [Shimia isoporae]
MSLIEHQVPFSIGESVSGSVPDPDAARHFVPYKMMEDFIEQNSDIELIAHIFEAFPDSRRFYVNVPPSAETYEIEKMDFGKNADFTQDDLAPSELRLLMYKIQTKILKCAADRNNADFIDIHESLVRADGFLRDAFTQHDPTHANQDFGDAMLDVILTQVEATR